MYGGMPKYTCPCSLLLSRIPTLLMKILMPVRDPNTSHANPYACPGSQRFTHKTLRCKSLHQGSLSTIPTIPYACPGSQRFTQKYLHLYRFPTIQTTPYAGEAS
ncbi:hypothetical protein O181_032955 [Austropuccinia psidii MF-1]|uniref:Uncharacterized protein n=1 Tax=Austropuccinia psidii MF-1 TaxID=1389203 RepID=A0A9Q3H8Q7_9BASI|nr:hypothetical protein [Austropuccinia psidii MF-1]